ncbi:MAG: hypothetical protein ACHQQQ_03035 [Bacteroidota bacterium]
MIKFEDPIIPQLPRIYEGCYIPVAGQYSLILASGFEDRTVNYLQHLIDKPPKEAFLILYKGESHKNKDDEIRKILRDMKVNIIEVSFDRRLPEEFEDEISKIYKHLQDSRETIIDISSMSKLLMMSLLVGLNKLATKLVIVYTESRIYKPSKRVFETRKRNRELRSSKLFFQTSDLLATTTTKSLSSSAMNNSPIFLIAFPTFNEELLITLFQEFSPSVTVIVHGVPLRKKDEWRTEAIHYINRHILGQIKAADQIKVSTYYYAETFQVLEKYYYQYKTSHKFTVGAGVSKLQSIAIAFFKLYRPDIQILYPTPKSYLLKEYSSQSSAIHSIEISNYAKFILDLREFRRRIDFNSPVIHHNENVFS